MRPSVFIVGAPKCGTSSLRNYLKQHPDIFMAPRKEMHYFESDLHKESDQFHHKRLSFPIRTEKQFVDGFKEATDEKFLGEATPTYLVSKTSAKEIYDFNPDAKVIAILREPVSMLYSFHSQLVFNQDEDIEDFRRALAIEPRRKKDWKLISRNAVTPTLVYYSEFVKYARQIERFKRYFPDMKIIIFDDLKEDTGKVVEDVIEYIGARPFKPDLKIANPNTVIRNKLLHRLVFMFKRSRIKHIIPFKLKKYTFRYMLKVTGKEKRRPPLDDKIRQELKKRFKPEVKKLSQLLKIDLVKRWDY
jgi:hypothetical protein